MLLKRTAEAERMPYQSLLIHVSLGDMLSSVSLFFKLNLNNSRYLLNAFYPSPAVCSTFMNSLLFGRYDIMAVTTIESYCALRIPLHYSSSDFIGKLNVWMELIYALSSLAVVLRGAFLRGDFSFIWTIDWFGFKIGFSSVSFSHHHSCGAN